MYDYAKYENATPKQLVYALSLAEKRVEKLSLQLKENEEFFKFLQKKLRNSFSTKKIKKEELTKETKAILAKDEPTPYTNFDRLLEAVDKEIEAENA